ncbi:MAG: T9SS type A sorting domain-containing protein [Melioribacteraceae bacterium]|jgi:hypothetical protein|nr:T9SS type A sorting domain-containing protein [Melioribacteraceae bacterium]
MKKTMSILIALLFVSSMMIAQTWEFDKVFLDLNAPQSNGTGFHGVAVDPDGNIWMAVYGDLSEEILIDGVDTTWTRPLLVMDPTGTPLSFSPLYLIEYSNSSVDTLVDNPRGLNTDKDGNILYTAYNTIYRIDYKTGKGLNKFSPQNGASLTNAAQSGADGTIYAGYVVPGGKPMFMLDNDFTLLGNATDSIFYINRSVVVSADGTDLYTGSTWNGFGVPKYHSDAPGLTNFAPVDTLGNWYDYYDVAADSVYDVNLWASTVAIGPDGLLWAGNLRPDYSGPKGGAWYAYDLTTGNLVETVGISMGDSTAGGTRSPRGIAWTADGNTMYTADFDYSTINVYNRVDLNAQVELSLYVDMNVKIAQEIFDPATDVVRAAGAFQDPEWTPADAPDMTDADNDGVYTTTYTVDRNTAYEYKFLIGTNWDAAEANNRSVYVGPSNLDVAPALFDNDADLPRTEIAISFQVNMELEIAASNFDPTTDTLFAKGTFNGWSGTTILEPNVSETYIYEGSAIYEAIEGEVIYYKFAYEPGGHWEFGGDYEHTVTASDIAQGYTEVPIRGFNNSTLATVVNQESVIRFIVDMNGAVDAAGVAFPSIDTVAMAGANPPLAWPLGGWPDDDPNVIYLSDDGLNGDATAGDDFWTVELTFPIYSPLTIQYKYGANWGLPSNNGINDNEGGVGSDHFLKLFPAFWSGEAIDVFGGATEEPVDVVNGVDQIGSDIPTAYELSQNYPNPFNPSTVINFSIPESGLVTMKIFNILGQEVAELVNDVKSAGSYEVSFDASSLTSGMYIYKIQSGNFSSTRKMMLLK